MINEIRLVKKAQKGNNESLIKLVEKYEKLYLHMARRYLRFQSITDFKSERYHFFYQTVREFNPERGMKFSSFLAQRTKYFCYKIANKKNLEVPIHTDHAAIEQDNPFIEELENIKKRLPLISDHRARKIILLRYFNKNGKVCPYAKIAPHVKMSPRNVEYLHDKFIQKIRNKT